MRDDAVQTTILGGSGDDNHLALRLGQAGITFHQRIMIRHKGAQLVRAMRQCHEHIRNKTGLFLNRLQHAAHIRIHILQ